MSPVHEPEPQDELCRAQLPGHSQPKDKAAFTQHDLFPGLLGFLFPVASGSEPGLLSCGPLGA